MKKLIISAVMCLAAISPAFAGDHGHMHSDGHMHEKMSKSIVDIAVSNADFSTLVAALKAADLVDALNGDGPFTVFAPTNAAFNKLPEGTVSNLLKPENKEKLQAVLKYHVVAASVPAKAAAGAQTSLKTLNGKEIAVDGRSGVKVNNANVVKADVNGSNGIIHVIDTVLLP